MSKRFAHGSLTLLVGVALGCASTPPTARYPEPETFQPPLGGVMVVPTPIPLPTIEPPMPPTSAPSCVEVPSSTTPVSPPQPPVVLPPPIPASTRIAYTGLFDYYPGHCYGNGSQLFYYDDVIKDVFAVPGAGNGVYNPEGYLGGNKFVFERDGHIWSYDLYAKANCLFDCGPNFATRPSITEDGCVMAFVGYPCGYLPPYGHDGGVAYVWTNGTCCELAPVNAAAVCQGGVNWISISPNGRWLVFTTAVGGLYTYDPENQMVCPVADASDVGPAAMPDISPDGTLIAFTALSGACNRPMIYVYNRLTDCIDVLPYANIALNAIATFYPRFVDNTRLTYEAALPDDPTCALLEYNLALNLTRTLSILNMLR